MRRFPYVADWYNDSAIDVAITTMERDLAYLKSWQIGLTHRCARCKTGTWTGTFSWDGARWLHRCKDTHPQAGSSADIDWEPLTSEVPS